MKKLFAVLLSVLVLGLGVSFAQTDVEVETPDVEVEPGSVSVDIAPEGGVDFDTSQYLGVSLPLPFSIYYGLEDVALLGGEGSDIRFHTGLYLLSFNLGADVLFDITQIGENIQLYGGGGLEVGTAVLVPVTVSANGIFGGEYRYNQEFGIFGELGAGINFPFVVAPRLTGGVNYHF